MSKREGGCFCGDIRYRVDGEPQFPHLCSCWKCRRWSGAPVVGWVGFAYDSVEWIGRQGWPTLYRESEGSQRGHCSRCGGTICAIDDGADTMAFTMDSLDDSNDLHPVSHSFSGDLATWISVDLAKSGPSGHD